MQCPTRSFLTFESAFLSACDVYCCSVWEFSLQIGLQFQKRLFLDLRNEYFSSIEAGSTKKVWAVFVTLKLIFLTWTFFLFQ